MNETPRAVRRCMSNTRVARRPCIDKRFNAARLGNDAGMAPASTRTPRVGLVLGGGGLVGQAYHAGALAALEHDTGWDARSADVIVGTSAGARTGLLLRAGYRPSELASVFTNASRAPVDLVDV